MYLEEEGQNRMNIGIITHHYIKNYGAFLQTYALQQYLVEKYPQANVFIINYVNRKHEIINVCGCFRFFAKRESLKAYVQKIKLPKTFSKAEKENFHLTKRVHCAEKINKLGLDVIIIGSDEVWNYEDKAVSCVKFAIGLQAKRIVAYAPSCGSVNLEHSIPDYVQKGLHNFTHISVRELGAETLVERVLGKRPKRVADPTFLYNFPVYEDDVTKKWKNEKYILMYYCDKLPKEGVERLKTLMKKKRIKLLGAGEYAKYYSAITVNLSPFQWIEMFRNAQFVFTGTFHGAVFSILMQRNFAAFLTNPSRIKKVKSLLEEFSLSDRIFQLGEWDKMEQLTNTAIDYSIVQEKKEKIRQESYAYLDQVLLGLD